ncbi:hypothetical protein TRIUR3_18426 [Triticum urartu]|uniref:Uncharacterized protein n=1 Tax=Triticum urartu TaxID=4572 RepID=M7ZU75_TRIUA|nr:hypothetical protein TRIUR3_18426 [Triticum urartu]
MTDAPYMRHLNLCLDTLQNSRFPVLCEVAAISWTIWRCRNNIALQRKQINGPIILIKIADEGGKSKGVDTGGKTHRTGGK